MLFYKQHPPQFLMLEQLIGFKPPKLLTLPGQEPAATDIEALGLFPGGKVVHGRR